MKKYRLDRYVGDWAALVLAFLMLVMAIWTLNNATQAYSAAYIETRECRELEHWWNELGIEPEVPVQYDISKWRVSYGIQRNTTQADS